MNILGISALYHDSACCLLKDGQLIAAVQEERFTKKKADPSMPVNAMNFCLSDGNISILDVDIIAYYEDPVKKLARQLWSGYDMKDMSLVNKMSPRRPEKEIREKLGFAGEIKFYDHHVSHAASSYFYSGFDESAILTVDGVGEWATTTYGMAQGSNINLFEEVHFPDSLGLLYAAITSYLGFKINGGEYKVMGLAPYGKPVYVKKLRQLIKSSENGQYHLDLKYFEFINGNKMYSQAMVDLLELSPRIPESELSQCYMDMARSIQVVIEEMLIEKAKYLYEKTESKNLCMAGGVALNCVANGKVLNNSPFENLYIQPAANDAGCALGAAALAHVEVTGSRENIGRMEHVYYGPEYSQNDIKKLLDATSLAYEDCSHDSSKTIEVTAKKLSEGKVIGWFQGKMEFGPRSLGCRSILADPRNPEMRDKINAMVKKREMFRPFAPSVLEDKASQHFDLDHKSPFMLETCQVISELDLPAITHVDLSARVQTVSREMNPKYYKLIEEFDKLTDCPMLLNTSFNVRGQPIVNTPVDALICFLKSGIDCLVMGDFIIEKQGNSTVLLEFMLNNYDDFRQSDLVSNVYTFL